ncbi:MAG: peptidoglycan recognition family protein [Armatimonadota bacterium]|nr:peptidoglycan recognition family protein [Armatimonadota bacterium]
MIGLKVSIAELKERLKQLKPTRTIDRIVVHHFYRPTAAQWKGLRTLEQVRHFHVEEKGWEDIGYHVVMGPDSTIWLARPIEQAGAHCKGQNSRSVGLAFAADFDTEDPAANGLATGHQAAAAICERFEISDENIFFHRDFAPKSCPGLKMSLEPFRREVGRILAGRKASGFIRLKIDGRFVWAADIHLDNGKAVGFEGPIAKAIGAPCSDQKRLVVVRDYLAAHHVVIPADGWRPDVGPAGTIFAVSEPDA